MDRLTQFTMETVGILTDLIKSGSYTHALVILYSSIDTLAWSNIPSGNVTRKNYCEWVDKYMKPKDSLGCSAIDLYSARCAVVHSFGASSSLSTDGDAKEIWYVSSPASKDALQDYADKLNPNTVVVHISDLIASFINASDTYQLEISKSPDKKKSVEQRINKWLKFIPANSI